MRGIEHGIFCKMRIAERGSDIGMAEQSGDDSKALAAVDRERMA